MPKPRKPAEPGLLSEPVMRRMVEAAMEFQRLRPWEMMWDTYFVGCRDERTGQLRVCSVLGASREVFGLVSYRGHEGLALVHTLLTEEEEPSREQFLRGMNCLKLDFSLKRELTAPDLARLKSVGYKPQGTGHVWPVFQSLRLSWAPWPVTEEEAIQLTEDVTKASRFAKWFEQGKDIYESHPPAEIPVVPLGDGPLTNQQIDWTPLLPPLATVVDGLRLSDAEAAKLKRLPIRAGISEVETAFMHSATFLDELGRRRVPRAVIMSDQASYFVQAVELFGDDPLPAAVKKVVLKGMTTHRTRPERIQVCDEKVFQILAPACARIGIELERVDKLVAAPDALASMSRHLGGEPP